MPFRHPGFLKPDTTGATAMAELHEQSSVYYIPDNFIEEGRILQGRFKLRNVIEGGVLSLATAAIGVIIMIVLQDMKTESLITMFLLLCAPTMAIGIAGFNGDPISVAVKSAVSWMKNRDTMLYNTNMPILKRDPLLTVINKKTRFDEIMEGLDAKKQESIERQANLRLTEGKDFVFAEDRFVDEYTKRKRKQSAKERERKHYREEKEYLVKQKDPEELLKQKANEELEFEHVISFSGQNDYNLLDTIGNYERLGTNTTSEGYIPDSEDESDSEIEADDLGADWI